ncbi:MAG: hypothetical protein FWG68_11345 [Defluviitaleaceae bacterium]|nr:hypothetical protein [Defluviitaleaceae bacterium]
MKTQTKAKIKKILLISFVTFSMFAFFVLIVDSLQFYLRATGIPVVDIQITETEVDTFLSTLNVPQSTLQAAGFYEKFAIYAALQEYPNATFAFSTLEHPKGTVTVLGADWEILQGENVRPINLEQIRQVGDISDEDLSFSLMIFSLNDQFNRFAFFPTFTWHKNANITNDIFGFTLDNSWRHDIGNASITVTGNFGNSTQTLRFDHSGTSFGAELGTAHRLNGVNGTQFQGTAAFFASPTETAETANRRITLSYSQDNSFFNSRQIPLEMANVFFAPQSRVANAQLFVEW